MGKIYDTIDEKIQKWMGRQHMFFVATAPLSADGSVNCSPKGNDTLRVLDQHTLAYLDTGGSGIETVAHLRENGRIVIMICAFEGPPKIYRFHGRGEVVTPNHPEFPHLAGLFDGAVLSMRSIIKVHVERISDSCGFGVPCYEYQKDRDATRKYLKTQTPEKFTASLLEMNQSSVDGLGGLTPEEIETFQFPTD